MNKRRAAEPLPGLYRFDDEVRFIRSIPGHASPGEAGEVVLNYLIEGSETELSSEPFDLVVLSVGLHPGQSSEELAQRLGVQLSEKGFVRPDASAGVFVAGTDSGPMDMAEVLIQARSTARACLAYLARN